MGERQKVKVFVTGATGFIGIQLVKQLAGRGFQVHALYRSEEKARLITIDGVSLYKGDIMNCASLLEAMKGCEEVYHIAAFAGVWSKDPSTIHRFNVDGTLNVFETAKKCGVRRIVVTSTAGILGPSEKGPVHEESPVPSSFFTPYEESKFLMEQELKKINLHKPEVIIVNPTRVYGPGYLSESNGVTKMIKRYLEGNWRLIPGSGASYGNYVHVEDVVSGHLLAMEYGKSGERYLLGGENITYNQLFTYVRVASGLHKTLYKVPLWIMLSAAFFMLTFSKIFGRKPLIVPGLVRKFNHNWVVSSEKAIREINYNPRGAETGITQTVEWIQSINQ
jgi:farnesol dehydrogenase